jgi:hypothetical protein
MMFVGEFGAAHSPEAGTLRAAVGEAAFLIGMERNPMNVKGVAYAPLLGNLNFPLHGYPAIGFDGQTLVKSPSYHVLEMFAAHRGDEMLPTHVKTYRKPLIRGGYVSVVCDRGTFSVGELSLDSVSLSSKFSIDRRTSVRSGGQSHSVVSNAQLDSETSAAPETPGQRREWRHLMFGMSTSGIHPLSEDRQRIFLIAGDSATYNYTFTATVRRMKEDAGIELRVRDNGLAEEEGERISLCIREGKAGLYQCSGTAALLLASPVPLVLEESRRYTFKIVCRDEQIACYLDDALLIEGTVLTNPTLVAVATREKETGAVLLKVVNTTRHEEWTTLHSIGGSFGREIEVIELAGLPDVRNTLHHPDRIVPTRRQTRFPAFRRSLKYIFPPNSVTILRLQTKAQ